MTRDLIININLTRWINRHRLAATSAIVVLGSAALETRLANQDVPTQVLSV